MAFMYPKSHQLVCSLLSFIEAWLSKLHVLNYLWEISQIELIVEFTRCWHELSIRSYREEDWHGSIDYSGAEILTFFVEIFHVVVKNLVVNGLQDLFLCNKARNQSHMSSETKIYEEGSWFWIHASSEHNIDQEPLFIQMISVIDDVIVNDLSYKTNWGLSSVFIKIRHVEVVHEVDKCLAYGWTKCSTNSLINLWKENNLECCTCCVVIEVDCFMQGLFFI